MSRYVWEAPSSGAVSSWIGAVPTLAIEPYRMSHCWISEPDPGMGPQVSIESSVNCTRSERLVE